MLRTVLSSVFGTMLGNPRDRCSAISTSPILPPHRQRLAAVSVWFCDLVLFWFEDSSEHRFISHVVPMGANWRLKEWWNFKP